MTTASQPSAYRSRIHLDVRKQSGLLVATSSNAFANDHEGRVEADVAARSATRTAAASNSAIVRALHAVQHQGVAIDTSTFDNMTSGFLRSPRWTQTQGVHVDTGTLPPADTHRARRSSRSFFTPSNGWRPDEVSNTNL